MRQYPREITKNSQFRNQEGIQEDLLEHIKDPLSSGILRRHPRASSSDEDEQQAKNAQLFNAVRKKVLEAIIIKEIKKLLDSGAEINALNGRGKTILDIARKKEYDSLVNFLSKLGGKAALDLADGSNNASYVQQHSEVISTNPQQQMQQSWDIDVPDQKKAELDALLLVDAKKSLTEEKLNKLNDKLQSGLETQALINSLMQLKIDINYQDPITKQCAVDIAWENGYYYSMLMLLEVDSKFPKDFTLDALYQDADIPEKLKTFVRERQELHQWIQNNELEKIQKFIANHQLSKFFSSENKSALETAAEYANVEALAYLINLQLPLKEIAISEDQRNLLEQVNVEGDTLVSVAAKSGKKDNVDFFIRCGIDINHHNKSKKSAVDLAWENKHYDVVLTLLKADSNFPNNFNLCALNEENSQKALKQFLKRRDALHERIKENHLEYIKDFTTIGESKLYLNSQGQSALFTAIENKKFVIYAFLRSIGCMFKNAEERQYINNLSQGEKDKIKTEMISKFPQINEGHILYLISKSKSQKPVENFKERIEKLYRDLDSIPEVSMILQVIQYTDYLDIVFDFDNENIKDINPAASEATKGAADYKDGRIYIAAKMEEKKLLGTLAHELTHLAMYIIYKNDCNPFDKLENDAGQLFTKITAKIKEKIKELTPGISSNADSPVTTLARHEFRE